MKTDQAKDELSQLLVITEMLEFAEDHFGAGAIADLSHTTSRIPVAGAKPA